MENITKPKLVFFQWKHQGSAKFIQLHMHLHVKCLSEFFEVIVINQDCDYKQICDTYKPDLTLFESGYKTQASQKIKIENTSAYPEIPKLGFHNGDSWCDCRAGFISDMEHWGIETFFSICTTTAEHTPEIAENLFVWPNFIDAEIYRDYSQAKIIPVMFNGVISPLYPWRQKINKIISQHYPSLICPHLGYNQGATSRMLQGEQYARAINASWFVPTCGTTEKEVVRKHFEIPGSKSCLITEKSPALEAAGFIDMQNCVFADESDVLDKLDYLFQNSDKLEHIINAGYQLVHSRHTLKQRDQIFQWFNLYKNLQPHQKIIQKNPFEPLTVVEQSSNIKNSYIISNGLVIELLRQGDEKLWTGKYEEAETLYLKSFNYIYWMPEPKLRLALCNLYKGNADTAYSWIIQPIQYTLNEYKAIDPDPVEWAYFIISLLCQGRLNDAIKNANKYPSLYHPELDRTRWVVNLLKTKVNIDFALDRDNLKYRKSVHQLPNRNFNAWIDNLSVMLKNCKQVQFAELLDELLGHKTKVKKNDFLINLLTVKEIGRLSRLIKSRLFGLYKNTWLKSKLIYFVLKPLNQLEKRYGYFLPYRFSAIKQDDFFSIVQIIAREEDIKTALIIGLSNKKGCNEAFFTGIYESSNNPNILCINIPQPQSAQQKHGNNYGTKYRNISSVLEENDIKKINKKIQEFQQENQINIFDVVLIDGSELISYFELEEKITARYFIIDDINNSNNYNNHHKLLLNPNYILLAHNPELRNGYAVFKNANGNFK